jgi:hypothetical protein
MSENEIFIAMDFESAGGRLGAHSTLAWGACVIIPELISFRDYWENGLVFYSEMAPDSVIFEPDAMKVGCSQLECLESLRSTEPLYDPASPDFSPAEVMCYMWLECEAPWQAIERFMRWLKGVAIGREPISVTDTVIFEGGRLSQLFGLYWHKPNPFGWGGLNLDSIYRGYAGKKDAKLRELGLADVREKPHKADQDAVFLAIIARELLHVRMGWDI